MHGVIFRQFRKGVVIWDEEDYFAEGYRQLSDNSTYTDIKNFNTKLLSDFTEKSNNMFKGLCNKNFITEKELKYFSYCLKDGCQGKMYLLPKIHEIPVISTAGLLQKKCQNI